MEALEAIFNRRSIRSFTPAPIPEPTLTEIAEAAIYAPSAMNRQLWQITVVTGAGISALAHAIGAHLNDAGYDLYKPSALILVSNERENRNAAEDCACALENIFLAACALEVGSVWINQLKGICGEPAIRQVLTALQIPASHDVYGMAALGYPAAPGREPNKDRGRIVRVTSI